MSFLTPIYLWALAGVGIPIIIHLFSRKKGKRINFPTVKFLKISKSKTGKLKKVEEVLILLLRTLLLALFVLILAGPVSKTASFFLRENYIVFLIDDSFSMSAENTWKNCKKAGIETLSWIRKPAKVSLVFLSGEYIPFSQNIEEIGDIINKSEISYAGGKLNQALEKSVRLLQGKKGNKLIYFFTDLQKKDWKDSPGIAVESHFGDIRLRRIKGKKIKLIFVDLGGENTENLSFKNISLIPGNNSCKCEIINWGQKEVAAELLLSDENWSKNKILTVPAKTTGELFFDIPETSEKIRGEILHNDRLKPDNSFYFGFSSPVKTKILLVGEEPSFSSFYVQKSLKAADLSRIEINTKKIKELKDVFLEKYQIVFLSNTGRVESELVKKLYLYVREGGNLINFPGERILPSNFNTDWELREENIFLMPAYLEKKVSLTKPAKIGYVETRHPLFIPFEGKTFEYVKTVTFRKFFTTKQFSGDILLKLDNGDPVLFEKRIGKGKVFLFTFSPDEKWTNFPLKPFFPVMMGTMLQYLSEREVNLVTVGEKVLLRVPEKTEKIEVFTPRRTGPPPRTSPEEEYGKTPDGKINLSPDFPGLWKIRFLRGDTKLEKTISVNLDSEEGNLKKISMKEIKKEIKGIDIYKVKGNDLKDFLLERGGTSDISDLFLNMAFLIFLLEIGLSNFFYYKKQACHCEKRSDEAIS